MSKTTFADLPTEIRLMVWEAAYDTSLPREVAFHFSKDFKCKKRVEPSPDANSEGACDVLLQLTHESREFMKKKLVTFSSDFEGRDLDIPSLPDYFTRMKISTSRKYIDLAKDKLFIYSGYINPRFWVRNVATSPDTEQVPLYGYETVLPLEDVFTFMFDAEAKTAAKTLTHLKISCDVNRRFGLIATVASEERTVASIAKVKAYLPCLQKLEIYCDSKHFAPVECWYTLPKDESMVTVEYCCPEEDLSCSYSNDESTPDSDYSEDSDQIESSNNSDASDSDNDSY
ncbi:hypothetical protein HYALB_00013152 [Hymenoscyphus albidus]|uniref:2EXR domain-containing protein n=1 Tax=Hymenoscyphus albidus TaxID=595503 RepID=A0A9N9LWC8_9HELO|nr:hypothetical protein HYALB_00013152 [Hymenoscyphus albidus]